jgi:ribulose-5-phosphate 4-epimerase/fuculose-1-phosphate aldolase
MDKDLADQVAGIAARVVASGAISANGHGNVSVRVPGAEEMYFTAGPSLRGHPASAVVRVGLDGTLLEGGYGPRGSAEAIANIRAAVTPGVPAMLLANHGVLVFHRTPDLAILAGGVVEEAAQASINAAALGGPVEIPPDLRAAALQRAMTFDSQGTVHA